MKIEGTHDEVTWYPMMDNYSPFTLEDLVEFHKCIPAMKLRISIGGCVHVLKPSEIIREYL